MMALQMPGAQVELLDQTRSQCAGIRPCGGFGRVRRNRLHVEIGDIPDKRSRKRVCGQGLAEHYTI